MATSDAVRCLHRHFGREHRPGLVSVRLFGSHARGTAHRESDVDVGVVFDRGALPSRAERSEASVELSSELIGALHQNEVQVVSLLDAPPELAARAVLEGTSVYCADPDADRSFVRTTLLRHADLIPFLRRTREAKLEALRR